MSCDAGEVTERLENELCYDCNYELRTFSNLSVTSPTSQLILQPFRRFIYATAHSPTLPLLHLRHSSFSNPSFACPTSLALHLIHMANRPCFLPPRGYYKTNHLPFSSDLPPKFLAQVGVFFKRPFHLFRSEVETTQ